MIVLHHFNPSTIESFHFFNPPFCLPSIMNLNVFVFWIIQISIHAVPVVSETKASHVSALNVMFSSLNSPSQLSRWKSSGGDPCGDSWEGIKCSGSSITEITLSNFELSGTLGYQLSNLASVTSFDLSNNNLNGDIPYQLPPNAVSIDLSTNSFTGSVPYSISQMSNLQVLNLGHNQLSNQLSDMFGNVSKLNRMDLSFNSISGDLPLSFKNLSSLTVLHIQNNGFTGSINVLADLPLKDLRVTNNKFTGWIPDSLQDIDNLETGGNSWSSGPAPPPPPGDMAKKNKNKNGSSNSSPKVSGMAIAGIVMGVLAVIAIIIALFSRRSPPSHFLDEDTNQHSGSLTPRTPHQPSKDLHNNTNNNNAIERKSCTSDVSVDIKPLSGLRPPPPFDAVKPSGDTQLASRLSSRRSTSVRVISYSLADLQTATANFATGRLLGEGSIGRVYKAKYGDGKVLAVKKIDSSVFQGRTEEFSAVVAVISKLHHTNITEVVGFCSEQGQHMLVYEYFMNGSLYEFLHMSDDFSKPLTWNTRVKIALGTAKALQYLHEVCSPSIIHMNIKSSNILLDTELNPRLSDYGLAAFYKLRSGRSGGGYDAPECTQGSSYTMKSDIYSLGVVMLELLTGRMPYDSGKAKMEQCLVRWATPQLHDIDALDKMVDPALRGLYPPKSVSRFADIIALCVQSEPEFRPPMSEVVQALVTLVQRSA